MGSKWVERKNAGERGNALYEESLLAIFPVNRTLNFLSMRGPRRATNDGGLYRFCGVFERDGKTMFSTYRTIRLTDEKS